MARLGLALAVAFVLAYLPYRLVDGRTSARHEQMKSELAKKRVEIRALTIENRGHRSTIAALRTDPRAIEDIARADLGMVYPSEVVFRIDISEVER